MVPSLDNIEEADYDYLILSNCSEKDRKKKEKEFPRGVKGNKKACDVKWLKQVMVSLLSFIEIGIKLTINRFHRLAHHLGCIRMSLESFFLPLYQILSILSIS